MQRTSIVILDLFVIFLESELTFGSVCSPSDFLALKEAMLKTSQKPENTEP